ncbi:carbohydrate ABC transporter permease [Jiangella alkaliphila]|uniref:Raffinose/stachyose/melibiose transport system permease protein n=1 Tax=Jiangella alkaliphila TaxID=419479 RepID=A0A1H2LE24_9ACTN|nr:sugar ABC transporter permease [Jiangella alkaliphila]SDU78975.1 raffinose/stachyose/melibiose transport system permease protein [Jiangella alkaliphila]
MAATHAARPQPYRSPAAGPRRRARVRRAAVGLGFMAPLLLVNLLVIAVPGALSVWYSFTNWTGLGSADFVGLDNYRRLFADPEFHAALEHNVLWTAFFLTVPMAMGLFGAFLLSRIRRFQILFRVAYFIPYVVATVVSGAIWQSLLNPDQGLGSGLAKLGIPWLDGVNFLGDQDLALGAVAFVNNWQWWGFLVVIFLASMQSVNPALYEAARLDGANAWREFWHVTLPGIRPTLMFLALMTVIWSFLIFDYIYILTQGGPAGSTDVLGTLLYRNAFANFEAGYAASVGIVMALVSLTAVSGFLLLRRRGWEI